MSLSDVFQVFVDGSAHPSRPEYGIGGIIVGEDRTGRSFSLRLLGKQNSLTAEILAACFALEMLNAGAAVNIHSDHQDLCRKINKGTVESWTHKHSAPVMIAYAALANAMKRHDFVEASYCDGNPMMKQAHRLARAGAVDTPGSEMAQIFAGISYKTDLPAAHKKQKPLKPRRQKLIDLILRTCDGDRNRAQALVGRALAI